MIPWLSPKNLDFPSIELALNDPNGLLAAGGDLQPERVLQAYYRGIFPWFNPGDPILWWSPNPRTVIFPQTHHISKSLRKLLRKTPFEVTFDRAFTQVMLGCAEPRAYTDETWIGAKIIDCYAELHRRGYGHSVEVWQDGKLVGGLYGLALGKVFFGESMFSRADNASKVALAHLVNLLTSWNFELIDCQVANNHLFSLGAEEIPRAQFQKLLVEFTHITSDYPNDWSQIPANHWSHHVHLPT